tara:strand:+ start:324 stop:1007 length:684 start_codon:yes stop_codon:yes gene_type:complete
MRRLPTGGALNKLNERTGCNARRNTVPIMALIEAHPTVSPRAVEECIASHVGGTCPCGIVSQGTVDDFSKRLFDAQESPAARDWRRLQGDVRFTLEECRNFMYCLFCEAPVRGRRFELASRELMEAALHKVDPVRKWRTRKASKEEDAGFAVDWVVMENQKVVAGVQVKPESAMGREDVIRMNREKHSMWGHFAVFHVYNDNGTFEDTDALARQISDAAAAAASTLG